MPERALHEDLGAYVLGMLDPGELETFRAHLAGCAECQRELEELEGTARLLARAPKAVEPRADLRVRTLAALQQAQAEAEHERIDAQPRRAGRRPWLSWGIGGAVAVAAATAALILGIQLGGDDGPAGELELRATLASVSGDATALAEVVKLGIGREIDFRPTSCRSCLKESSTSSGLPRRRTARPLRSASLRARSIPTRTAAPKSR